MSQTASTPTDHWNEAGQAWGARSVDWAYLFEPYARPAIEAVGFDAFCAALREVIEPMHVDGLGIPARLDHRRRRRSLT